VFSVNFWQGETMRLIRNTALVVLLFMAMVTLAGCGGESDEGGNAETPSTAGNPDGETSVEPGEATALDTLHRTTSVSATLAATHPNGYEEKRRVWCEDLEWQGTSFTGSLSDTSKGHMKTEETNATVSGEVSADGRQVLSIEFDQKMERVSETPRGDVTRTIHTKLTLTDVPLGSSNMGERPYLRYKLDAPIDPAHVSYKLTNTDSDGSLESELPEIFLQEGDLVVHFGTM
jgi:hypothetical protein